MGAFAGTGKTSTLELLARRFPQLRFLYIAFNRATADEAKGRFPSNVTSKTAHSLAYGPTIKIFPRDRQTFRVTQVIQQFEKHPAARPLIPLVGEKKGAERRAALLLVQTVTRFCQSDRDEITERDVPAAFGQRFEEGAPRRQALKIASDAARSAWKALVERGSRLMVFPDVYLKYWALGRPELDYDVILFDEAQDANGVMLGLVMGQKATQVYVGDSHQQIYAFRGAVNAMEKAPGRRLALTQSWRFGPQIAGEANVLLGMLGESKPLVGGGPAGTVVDDPENDVADAVLCRGNAGVLEEVLWAFEAGIRVAVVGGVEEAAKLMENAYMLYDHQRPWLPELGLFENWDEFKAFSESDDGGAYRPTVRAVEEHRQAIPALCERLRRETVREKEADLVVSTAHKAKGREWDRVRFASDFPALVDEPEREGYPYVLKREEANLVYVSVTRARKHLNLGGYGQKIREAATKLDVAALAFCGNEDPPGGDQPEEDHPDEGQVGTPVGERPPGGLKITLFGEATGAEADLPDLPDLPDSEAPDPDGDKRHQAASFLDIARKLVHEEAQRVGWDLALEDAEAAIEQAHAALMCRAITPRDLDEAKGD